MARRMDGSGRPPRGTRDRSLTAPLAGPGAPADVTGLRGERADPWCPLPPEHGGRCRVRSLVELAAPSAGV